MAVKTSSSEDKGYSPFPASRAKSAAPGYSTAKAPFGTRTPMEWPKPTTPSSSVKKALVPFSSAIKNSFNPANPLSGPAWVSGNLAATPQEEEQGGGYVDPTAAYRDQSAKDRARLEALYNAYASQIAGNEAGINTNYGTSASTLGNIYGGAAAATNAGYDAMRAAQTAQLQALGLTGGAPSESFGAQLDAAGRYTNLGTASQALNEAQRNAAIAGNQSLVGAIRGEQRGAMSDFDRMTQENIAAQQQAAAEAAASAASAQARAQADADSTAWNRQFKYDQLAAQYAPKQSVDYASLVGSLMQDKGFSAADAISLAKLYG